MKFKVKRRKPIRIEHKIDDTTTIWVDIKPKISEEIDYKRLFSLTNKEGKIEITTKDDDGKEKVIEYDSGTYNAFLYNIRASIIGWCEDFVDEDEKPLEFNEDNQIAIFEAIKDLEGMFEKLTTAFTGITEKN